MTDPENRKSASDMLSDALNHVSTLVRKEVDLARAEISENLTKAAVALGMIVAGVIVALTTLNVLSAALVGALTEAGIDPIWSALIVGISFAVIAVILLNKGMNDLKASSLAPTRTAKNVKRDATAIKDAYNDK
ncbi:MAG TPA: phage holin family protein [Roseovarius sp.]